MFTEIQKDRIEQRFQLFVTHMSTDKHGKDVDPELKKAVQAITIQMTEDEEWVAKKLEFAYARGQIDALLELL